MAKKKNNKTHTCVHRNLLFHTWTIIELNDQHPPSSTRTTFLTKRKTLILIIIFQRFHQHGFIPKRTHPQGDDANYIFRHWGLPTRSFPRRERVITSENACSFKQTGRSLTKHSPDQNEDIRRFETQYLRRARLRCRVFAQLHRNRAVLVYNTRDTLIRHQSTKFR